MLTKVRSFTLIETLAVLAILAISLALVGPRIMDFTRSRELEVEAKKFRNWTRYARSQAVSTGRTYIVEINSSPGHNSYVIRYCLSGASLSSSVIDRTIDVAKNVSISNIRAGNVSSGYWYIFFDSLGSTSTPVEVYFATQVGGTLEQKVVSISTTGRIYIKS